jgi:hypothetical protein
MVREGMRGDDQQQNHIFSYLSPEERVRKDHPLRAIRKMVDEVLTQLSRRFDAMYARVGRPSIAPEKLLRAQLLQMLYSIRSERLLSHGGHKTKRGRIILVGNQFEGLADQASPARVWDGLFAVRVIQIAKRRNPKPPALLKPLPPFGT